VETSAEIDDKTLADDGASKIAFRAAGTPFLPYPSLPHRLGHWRRVPVWDEPEAKCAL